MRAARRGEVWLANFDPVLGHERAGYRPALVLSVDAFNAGPAGLVTVLPFTTTNPPLPSRVEVRPPEGGLSRVSYVMGEQTRTVSSSRLIKPLGAVSASTMARTVAIVRTLLGL